MSESENIQAPVEAQHAKTTEYVRTHADPYSRIESLVRSILRKSCMARVDGMPSDMIINNIAVRLTLLMYLEANGSMSAFTDVDTFYERFSAAMNEYRAIGMSDKGHTV